MSDLSDLATALRQVADVIEGLELPPNRGAADELRPRLLPYPEAARYLGIGEGTLHGLVTAGRVVSIGIGRRVLFDLVELDSFVERVKLESV